MKARRIVVLTGAGISQESGLDTFRDPNGIWSKYRVEDVATPEAFARDPRKVHDFYTTCGAAICSPATFGPTPHMQRWPSSSGDGRANSCW